MIGKYIAGSVLVAVLAGVVMLIASLALGVPLAPLIGVWVAMTNLIPQIGGLLGAVPFVLLGIHAGRRNRHRLPRDLPRSTRTSRTTCSSR